MKSYLQSPLAVVFLIAAFLPPAAAYAQATVSVGDVVNPWSQLLSALWAGLIPLIVGWAAYAFQKYTGIKTDQAMRDALSTAVDNAGSLFVAHYGTSLTNAHLTLQNPTLATLAKYVVTFVPDAVSHFGLTQAQIAQKIIAAIPQIPDVTVTSNVPVPAAVSSVPVAPIVPKSA